MTTYYFVADIIWEGVPFLVYPDKWDPHKTQVGAYDDEAHTCYAFTESEAYWNELKKSPRVTEISQEEYVANIQRLVPPRTDVEITFNIGISISDRVAVEKLLKGKGWKYRIEEHA